MQTIIVATDYSKEAQNALDYAACLAKQSNSKIVLYNSYRISVHAANGLISPETITKLVQENRENLKQTAARISKKYQIPVEYHTKYCSVEEGLNELAESIRADMIVMGM
jgi:nucleotide-binding universal stress UspA family protein